MFLDLEKFDNIIFDCDSTLSTIEGIDELAKINGAYQEVKAITQKAMNGEVDYYDSLKERLELIKPTRQNIVDLGSLYIANETGGAKELIELLTQKDKEIFIISASFSPAVNIFTSYLGIKDENVYTNSLFFDTRDKFIKVDANNPLAYSDGKVEIVKSLKHRGTSLFIGDGMSDLKTREHVTQFVGFCGVIKRDCLLNKDVPIVSNENILRGLLEL